jgi:hypothetical protein
MVVRLLRLRLNLLTDTRHLNPQPQARLQRLKTALM